MFTIGISTFSEKIYQPYILITKNIENYIMFYKLLITGTVLSDCFIIRVIVLFTVLLEYIDLSSIGVSIEIYKLIDTIKIHLIRSLTANTGMNIPYLSVLKPAPIQAGAQIYAG